MLRACTLAVIGPTYAPLNVGSGPKAQAGDCASDNLSRAVAQSREDINRLGQSTKSPIGFGAQVEAYPGRLRQIGEAIHHLGSVSQSAEWLEAERIDFRPTQAEGGNEMQTEQVPSVRPN